MICGDQDTAVTGEQQTTAARIRNARVVTIQAGHDQQQPDPAGHAGGGHDRIRWASGSSRASRPGPRALDSCPGAVFADPACALADGADAVIARRLRRAALDDDWRLVDARIDAAHLPAIRAAGAQAIARSWPAGPALAPPGMAAPRYDARHHHRPLRQQAGHGPDLEEDVRATTRCWCFWTTPTPPAVKHWPGCCGRATSGPTPRPTTSPSWGGCWKLASHSLPSEPIRSGGPTDPAPPITAGSYGRDRGRAVWCTPAPMLKAFPRRGAPPSGAAWRSPDRPPARARSAGFRPAGRGRPAPGMGGCSTTKTSTRSLSSS